MKKILLVSASLILLSVISIYAFIPDTIRIQRKTQIRASDLNALKYISSVKGWEKWWPEKNANQNRETKRPEFCYQSFCYQVLKTTNSGAEVQLMNNDIQRPTKLSYLFIGMDSLEVTWQTDLKNGYSPVKRVLNYQKYLKISKNFDEILGNLKTFFDNEKLIYGIDIKHEIVKNKVLLTMEKTSAVYPDVNFIYGMVADIRSKIKDKAAEETASPMLNIYKPYQEDYKITVAIPISKEIPSTKSMYINKMVEGKLLLTEVKGGPQTIKNAFSAFKQYVEDKRITSPAMPYEMMITDRSTVRDSSKWITQIYYPVL